MKKLNLLSKSKFVLIAMLVVIVVGATLFGIFGFNNSPAVGTGYQVSIKTEIDFPGNSDKIKEVADEVLSYENYYIALDYHSEQIFETKNKVSAETIATLKAKLETAINANNANPIEITVTQSEISSHTEYGVLEASLTLVVVLAIVCLYLMLRQRLSSAFAVVLSAIAECVFFTFLVSATRVVVTPYLYAVITLSVIASLFAFVFYTASARKLTKKQAGVKQVSAREATIELENSNVLAMLIMAIAIVVVGALMLIFGSAIIRWTGVAVILSAISIALTGIFVLPVFRLFFAEIGERRKVSYKGKEIAE